MQALSARQQAAFDFIRSHIETAGTAPTLAEIAQALGLAQACGARKHVQRLAAAGYLELVPHRARGIRLAAPFRKPAPAPVTAPLVLPLVGQVAAGMPLLNPGSIERTVSVDRWLFRPRPDYLLRVSGTSMVDAGILDGDLIAVHATPDADHGRIVVARLGGLAGDGITVKRLYRRNGVLRLLSQGAGHADIEPDPSEDFAIEGLFAGVVRRA